MPSPRSLAAALGCVVGLLLPLVTSAPAQADARIDVTNDEGTAEADLTYRTVLAVTGSGFQVVPGGFGGVYVMFGWVSDADGDTWRPSRGGLTGQDYQYIPDTEVAETSAGYLRYIAFPGGSTADEASAVLSSDGDFTVDLTVPGPVFESIDRTGEVARVDCRETRCGVITVGAHGVANARNESFTPVSFTQVYDAEPLAALPAPETVVSTASQPSKRRSSVSNAAAVASVGVDRTTAIAGHALAFTAQGFSPGEQVLAVLDDGKVAVGPLTAGASGEVATALQLPDDLATGTHELRLTGAASGTEVAERFPAIATSRSQVTSSSAEPAATTQDPLAVLVLVGAAALLLLAAAAYVRTLLAARRPTTVGAP